MNFREDGKKREKKGGETFWRVFDWEGGRENVWWGPSVFFLSPLESFLPKMEENRGEENHSPRLTKMPMWTVHMDVVPTSSPFFFFSSFCFVSSRALLLSFLFFPHLHCAYTIIFAKKICYFFVCKYTIVLLKKSVAFLFYLTETQL